ncbi:MAG: phosphotransferase family protein [Deltaproteobacteria bacterium]|nr:MAG: phosphotransferase family protein [Deltaproteobacteria bacterium]
MPTTAHIDEPSDVRDEERIDPEKLRPFLERAFGRSGEPVSVLQFRKGHSNLTYLVRYGSDEAVLRRAPFGVKVKTAHDMRREFTILSALQGAYEKAPRPIGFCDDETIIGARFYLMERRRGVVLRGAGEPAAFEPDLLRALSTALVENLADLHAVDVTTPALAAIGHPNGYVARQVEGWTARYANARTDEIEDIESVARWVNTNLPGESGAAVVHNDYKYDNVMLDPANLARIVAVLDWEMATVGDPLLDLGTLLGYWSDPDDPPEMRARPYGPTFLPGSLSRKGVVEAYARKTGRESFSPLFYYVFALFKIAVIVQQIYKRYVEGSTSDPRFRALGQWVRVLGRQAALALEKGRIDRLGTGA